MTVKSGIAVGMILICCAWSAWLFGSVDWAGAQKDRAAIDYAPDTAILSVSAAAESTEKTLRAYLQDAERSKSDRHAYPAPSAPGHARDLFASRRTAAGTAAKNDEPEVIYIDTPKIQEKPKPVFPVDRYRLTGAIMGPDPKAFIFDALENKSFSLRIKDKIGEGTVTVISADAVVVTGDFGSTRLKK